MKAYIVKDPGKGVGAWSRVDLPEPKPGDGEVLVRMRAASLNYRDLMIARRQYPGKGLKADLIPLSDGAGEVILAGHGSRFKSGDRVIAGFHQDWLAGPMPPTLGAAALGGAIDGVLCEQAVFKDAGLVTAPEHLSFEEAATLPCAALTAWNALMERPARLLPGQSVLIQGSGGVSIFALQLAKLAGCLVVGTSKDDAKLARMKSLGLDAGINYAKNPEWQEEARKATDGAGVDLVIEVGGSTLPKSLAALKIGGTAALIGGLAGFEAQVPLSAIRGARANLECIFVGSIAMFESMNRAIAAARLKPVIDSVFDFDRAPEALAKLGSGTHFGKIVVRIP